MISRKLPSTMLLLVIFALLVVLSIPLTTGAQDAGTLTWSIEGKTDLVSLDPAKASDSQDFTVVNLIYGGLVRLDGDLHVTPDVAESWTVSDDGLTYTFTLRENAKFSDGSAITSADVIWSLTHSLDPNTGGWTGPFYLSNIVGADDIANGAATELTGAKAVDDRTIALTIKQPSAFFLSQLTFGSAKIISKAAAEANPDTWSEKPVSSGAFAVDQWNHGQNLCSSPMQITGNQRRSLS